MNFSIGPSGHAATVALAVPHLERKHMGAGGAVDTYEFDDGRFLVATRSRNELLPPQRTDFKVSIYMSLRSWERAQAPLLWLTPNEGTLDTVLLAFGVKPV